MISPEHPSGTSLNSLNTPQKKETSILLLVLVLMALAWIPPGLFGHEPWKPDEGYTIGLINHMTRTGDWVVPTLTGEPFMEKPPIFFITASLFAQLLSPDVMPLHQAAALATALYMALMFLFSYLAGREVAGAQGGMACVLGLMGCIGLTARAHSAITDTAMWCGFAMAGYGMVLAERKGWTGAFWFGTGSGLTFMAKGFQGPAFIGVAALLLPVFCSEKRSRAYAKFIARAFLFSLPWLIVWPAALYRRSPELFNVWLFANNLGRFLGEKYGYASLTQQSNPWKYVLLFPWFTLPLWPAAVLAWRRKGAGGRREAGIMFPTLIVLSGFAILTAASGRRELYLIPLLPPLALIAAQCVHTLPEWLDVLMRKVMVVVAGTALAVMWVAWLGWRVGWPAALAERVERFAPGLASGTGRLAVGLAVLYSAGWVVLYGLGRVVPRRWDWAWAGGMTAVWGVAMLLFMPIMNHGNGYRSMFEGMVARMPTGGRESLIQGCRFGESQRAILEYYFDVVTRDVERYGELPDTEYYLVQMSGGAKVPYAPKGKWKTVWEGARPGDRRERYILLGKNENGE